MKVKKKVCKHKWIPIAGFIAVTGQYGNAVHGDIYVVCEHCAEYKAIVEYE